MKALALDCAAPRITFLCRNEEKTAKLELDIGMHQSEELLPSIEKVLSLAGLTPSELEFLAITGGPGTFTGLRLGFACLKALEFAKGIPLYGIPTLEAVAYPFRTWPGAVVPVIDAKKDRFYAAVYRNGILSTEPMDAELSKIAECLDSEERILAVGADAEMFAEQISESYPQLKVSTFSPKVFDSTEALLELAQKRIIAGENPMQDYDGPVYIRVSEAEEKLQERK